MLDRPDHFYFEGHFLRVHAGSWQRSSSLAGPWSPCSFSSIPPGLRKAHPPQGEGPRSKRSASGKGALVARLPPRALFLPFPASTLLYQLWFFRRGLPAGFSRLASWLVTIAQLIALGLLLTAALGHAGPREFGFYLSAILLALFNASVLFVRLHATSFRRDEPAA